MEETNEKGITLIALVITIIILLILAGVSIAMLTGDNGILTQAKKADVETRGAAVEEAKDLWESNKTLDEATGDSTDQSLEALVADLKSRKLLINDEPNQVLTTGQVTIGSRTIVFGLTLVDMFENAESCDKTDGTCTDETHLHIGDYVNYKPESGNYKSTGANTGMNYYTEQTIPDEMKNQVFNVDTSTTWRVLGVEGTESDKHILLVSGSPIKKETTSNDPYYYLYGAYGYKNAETELKNICAIYGNGKGADSARSLTAEDINTICGVTVDPTGIKPEGVDEDGIYGQKYSYTNQFANAEDFIAGTRTDFEKTSNAYYYSGDNSALKTGNNQNLYNMIFYPNGVEQQKKEYWLASRCVYTNNDNCNFNVGAVFGGATGPEGYYLFRSFGTEDLHSCAVRPVISLKSGVSTDTIQKISKPTEEDWSSYNRTIDN